ncbi:MAG: hypothetical protein MJ142_06810 [Clostridia bacterium]|nr:hypothetical protein [Clostridia bacterium]
MSRELYEVIALAARYLFVFLGIVIVLRSFLWLRKDRAEKHRRLKALPDAGMIGELVVLRGSRDLPEGMSVPVPREGVLGYVRGCDMVIPCAGVRKRHLDLRFEDGNGLLVIPRSGCEAAVDGHMLNCRSRFAEHPMLHGSVLEVGDAALRLRLFSGISTERSAAYAQDMPPVPVQPAYMPDACQAGPGMMPASMPDPAAVPYPAPVRQSFPGPAVPYNPGIPDVPPVPASSSPDTVPQKRVRRSDRWKEGRSE